MTWVVFDHGGVLAHRPERRDFAAMATALGGGGPEIERAYHTHRRGFDLGELEPAVYWALVAGRPLDAGSVERLVDLDTACWGRPQHGTIGIVTELLARGVAVALLSNQPACLAQRFERVPWLAGIERRYYSGRMKLLKPDAAIYLAMAGDLPADPTEITFIDDTAVNVHAARRLGMEAIVFEDPSSLRAGLRRFLVG